MVWSFSALTGEAIACLPFVANAAVTSYAVLITVRALSEVNYEPKNGAALVAALAEANVPLFVAALVSLWTSLVIALTPSLARASGRRSRLGSTALLIGAAGFLATTTFVSYLSWNAAKYRPGFERSALVPFVLAVFGLTFAVAALSWRRTASSAAAEPRRSWFLIFAAFSAITALLLWRVVNAEMFPF